MAFHKSTDGGKNWITYKLTTTSGYGNAVAIDPNNDSVVYVGGEYYKASAGGLYVGVLFKSTNGGSDWTEITGNISGLIYEITVDPTSPNRIYAGTRYRVYKSEDYGSSWTESSSILGASCIKINPASTNEIFAGGWRGVYSSDDGGSTWADFNTGLISDDIECLDINGVGSLLYAGSRSGGVYKNNLLNKYTLIIMADTGGTTDPSPGGYTYDSGTEVTITATPDSEYEFVNWSGDASGTSNSITITMDSDKSITANFTTDFTLTISAGTGGTTIPSPGTYTYEEGTGVTVTATPDNGNELSNWSGNASGTSNPITITMDSDKSITANFSAKAKGEKEGGEEKEELCFIATAAYDSALHPHVEILRGFRDKYLMSNKFGRSLVFLYYRYSPFVANIISNHKVFKVMVRISLLPFIAFSYSMVHFGPIITTIMLGLIFGLQIFSIVFFRKKLKT